MDLHALTTELRVGQSMLEFVSKGKEAGAHDVALSCRRLEGKYSREVTE